MSPRQGPAPARPGAGPPRLVESWRLLALSWGQLPIVPPGRNTKPGTPSNPTELRRLGMQDTERSCRYGDSDEYHSLDSDDPREPFLARWWPAVGRGLLVVGL